MTVVERVLERVDYIERYLQVYIGRYIKVYIEKDYIERVLERVDYKLIGYKLLKIYI